jgi:hypothetical protein
MSSDFVGDRLTAIYRLVIFCAPDVCRIVRKTARMT